MATFIHFMKCRFQVLKSQVWCFNNASTLSHCSTRAVRSTPVAVFTFKLNYPLSVINFSLCDTAPWFKAVRKKCMLIFPRTYISLFSGLLWSIVSLILFPHQTHLTETLLPLKAVIHHHNKRYRSITWNMTCSLVFAALSLFCPLVSTRNE